MNNIFNFKKKPFVLEWKPIQMVKLNTKGINIPLTRLTSTIDLVGGIFILGEYFMKKYLNSRQAYIIIEHEDGYYLSDGNGFVLKSEELMDIGKNLIKFSKKHNEDILEYNNKRQIELYNEMTNWLGKYPKEQKEKPKGYIYIMECGGKYKIGLSKNVERRKKELNNRPFPVNIIYKSKLISDVYKIEENLHNDLKNQRIDGEWFNLNDELIEYIQTYLEEL